MDFNQLNSQINAFLQRFKQQINRFLDFLLWRLKNFAQMTLAEQIAYPCIFLGLVLIITSLILIQF